MGALAGSAITSAVAAHLLCPQEVPAGPACTVCHGVAGPVLPDGLLFDRGGELPAEMLAGSLDLAGRGDTKPGYHLSSCYF